MLQYVAVFCSVLQCVAVCCSVLQRVAACFSVSQCVAVCCIVLHCVALCCAVLQCVVVCRSVSQCVVFLKMRHVTRMNESCHSTYDHVTSHYTYEREVRSHIEFVSHSYASHDLYKQLS